MSDHGDWLRAGRQGFYAEVAAAVANGEGGVIATVIGTDRSSPRHVGAKMLIRADGTVSGSVGGGISEARAIELAAQVLADGRCRRETVVLDGKAAACGGQLEIFLEPIDVARPLWIIGAGHVGRAVADMAVRLPWRVTVVDDRPEFLQGVEEAAVRQASPAELSVLLQPDVTCAVVVATRDHVLDGDYLEAVLRAEEAAGSVMGYLGCVGSRRKATVLRGRLDGFAGRVDSVTTSERLDRIRVPVGLAIGAETPHEIALSILAEIHAEGENGRWLRDADGRRQGVRRQQRGED